MNDHDDSGCRVCGHAVMLTDGMEWPFDGPICWECLYNENDALADRVKLLESELAEMTASRDHWRAAKLEGTNSVLEGERAEVLEMLKQWTGQDRDMSFEELAAWLNENMESTAALIAKLEGTDHV